MVGCRCNFHTWFLCQCVMSPNTVWGIQSLPNHHFCEEFMQPWQLGRARLTTGLLLSTCEVAQGWCMMGDLRHPSSYTWTASTTAKCSLVSKLTLQIQTPPTTCLRPSYESVNGKYLSEGPYKNQLSVLCFLAVAAVISLLLSARSRTWQWMLCPCKDNS